MKCLLSVSLATLIVVAHFVLTDPAQTAELRKGVSVQMARSTHAVAYTAADNADAWIVTVTADGSLYFGLTSLSAHNLHYDLKASLDYAKKNHPSSVAQELYIKADRRTPFLRVERVIWSALALDLNRTVLLTSRAKSVAPGSPVPPQGMEVLSSKTWNSNGIVIEVLKSDAPETKLKLNNTEISVEALQTSPPPLLQKDPSKWVAIFVDGSVSFEQAANVIDVCRGLGGQVVLPVPRAQ